MFGNLRCDFGVVFGKASEGFADDSEFGSRRRRAVDFLWALSPIGGKCGARYNTRRHENPQSFLLDKGYVVHGIKRRTSLFNTKRIDHIFQDSYVSDRRLVLHHGDMTDSSSLVHITEQVQPDEIYNLAAQSHVAVSFEEPEYTANSDALGTLRLLEAIRILGLKDKARFYQASTSELFGLARESPQSETTPFYPRSPYDHGQLPRGLRPFRLQRHPVQRRIPGAGRDLRQPEDHPGACANQSRPAGLPLSSRRGGTGPTPASTWRRNG